MQRLAWGTPSTGFQPYDGKKRAVVNLVSRFGEPFFNVPTDYALTRFEDPNDSRYQRLGGVGASGDSGGGWFIDVNGEMQLVAISAFQIGAPDYFALSGGLQTSLYNDWIVDTMNVPEPSSLMLSILSISLLFQRRRLAA